MKQHLKNFSYVIASNLFTVLSSSLVVLILPKLMGVAAYGYWQLYIFYLVYIGFFHLGWIDGIYLRYGGAEYDSLDKKVFQGQTLQLTLYLVAVSLVLLAGSFGLHANKETLYVYHMVIVSMVLTNLRAYFIYILQMTNRLRESSVVLMSDRAVYLLCILGLIVFGKSSFYLMIGVDVLGRTVSVLYAMWLCREMVLVAPSNLRIDFKETWANISVGIHLMLSNIASSMIIGLVRFGIQLRWSVETFGKVSLTLSISNLMMTFINAIGIVVFPLLRRTTEEQLPNIYITLRNALMWVMFGVLFVYYPLSILLNAWLPAYRDSLIYMALIFPMSVYEGKMALLINTYYKALRMEKTLLRINVGVMLTSLILTLLATQLLSNLDVTVFSILFLLMFRSIVAEIILSKRMALGIGVDLLLELGMTVSFVLLSYLAPVWASIIGYIAIYVLYTWSKRKSLMAIKKQVYFSKKAA